MDVIARPSPTDRVFVAADWSQLETWLTAYFSGDKTMQAELDAQLKGGHKIHALNAGLIYGVDPADAKTYKVNLKGQMRPAYDAGKRFGHAFNYGMDARKMSETFWITKEFARDILERLRDKYFGVVRWRERLADEVYGIYRFVCPTGCGYTAHSRGRCPDCSTSRVIMQLVYDGVVEPPARLLRTPFGRRRLYLGRRREGMNALASQLPQSCGISIWYRTFLRLHGYDPYETRKRALGWPILPGTATWSPRMHTYGRLYAPYATFIATGTYDSFLIETRWCDAVDAGRLLLWTMEQPWPELAGRRFPVEIEIGANWMKRTDLNPRGLDRPAWAPAPFEARCPRRARPAFEQEIQA